MNFNSDELEGPPWMDDKFFEKALRTAKSDPEIVVTKIDVKPGSGAGDHFASIMFRVTIDFNSTSTKSGENQTLVVIAKTMPFAKGGKTDALKESNVFNTEIKMYKEVLPEMERLLESMGVKERFCPKVFFAAFEPAPIILLEDLAPGGFKAPDKAHNFETAGKIARIIARFHATSMKMQENGTDLNKFFDSTFFSPKAEQGPMVFYRDMLKPIIKIIIDEVKTWPGFEKHAAKLDFIVNNNFKIVKRLYLEPERNAYNVLNHGDFHFKNTMVNKVGDQVQNVQLLDYQMCLWTSPALDLISLLFLMSDSDTRENHRAYLIRMYYDEFQRILKGLDYQGKIPTLLDLNIELLRNGFQEIFLGCNFMLFHFMDLSKGFFSETGDRFAPQRQAAKHPDYQEFLKKQLDRWWNLGLLDPH